MYAINQLMFPPEVIPSLESLRGPEWQGLVSQASVLPVTDARSLAFSLMMIRLGGCMECETDSYRAMRGCHLCAAQTVRRFKGADKDLIKLYHQAVKEIEDYLARALVSSQRQAA